MFTVTKTYRDLPAAHRQPLHDGHCRLIHGHNWTFEITFGCGKLEEATGFVVDLGKLDVLKKWMVDTFDHTLLLNSDDPWLSFLQFHLVDVTDPNCPNNGCQHLAKIVTVPNCGMEGLAEYVFHQADKILNATMLNCIIGRGLRVVSVVCREDSKNAARYTL